MAESWALVTGATAGIGKETARLLAGKGYNLYITGRRVDRLEHLARELSQEFSIQVSPLVFDIRDRKAAEEQLSKVKKLGLLVNNAGLALGAESFEHGQMEDWDQMIDTNVKGLLYSTRILLPSLLDNTPSTIVNVGSVAGRYVYPGGAVYNATKFAVRAISEGLRMDLLGKGVRVVNIEPGMVDTEFSKVRYKEDEERAKQVYQGMTPLSAQDIAETICWCVDRPPHVNIQELVIYPTDQASVYHVNRNGEC